MDFITHRDRIKEAVFFFDIIILDLKINGLLTPEMLIMEKPVGLLILAKFKNTLEGRAQGIKLCHGIVLEIIMMGLNPRRLAMILHR